MSVVFNNDRLLEIAEFKKRLDILAKCQLIIKGSEIARSPRKIRHPNKDIDMYYVSDSGPPNGMFIVFSQKGCVIKGFDPDSGFSPWAREDSSIWPGIYDDVPPSLLKLLDDPVLNEDGDYDKEEVTFCIWRGATDSEWRKGGETLYYPGDSAAGRNDDGGFGWLADNFLCTSPEEVAKKAEHYHDEEFPVGPIQKIWNGEEITQAILKELPEWVLEKIDPNLQEAHKLGTPPEDTIQPETAFEALDPNLQEINKLSEEGERFLQQSNFKQALESFEKALALCKPGDAYYSQYDKLYAIYGCVYNLSYLIDQASGDEKEKLIDAAIKYSEQALDMADKPGMIRTTTEGPFHMEVNRIAGNALGWCMMERGNLGQALAAIKRAVECVNDSSQYAILDTQVRILLKLGRTHEAFLIVDRVLAEWPDFGGFQDIKNDEGFQQWRAKQMNTAELYDAHKNGCHKMRQARLKWVGCAGGEGGPLLATEPVNLTDWFGSQPIKALQKQFPGDARFADRLRVLHYFGQFSGELPAPFTLNDGHGYLEFATEAETRAKLEELRDAVVALKPGVWIGENKESGSLTFVTPQGQRMWAYLEPAPKKESEPVFHYDEALLGEEAWVLPVGQGQGLFYDLEGAGTADVGISETGDEIVFVRSWLDDEEAETDAVHALVDAPRTSELVVGEITFTGSHLIVVWSPLANKDLEPSVDQALVALVDQDAVQFSTNWLQHVGVVVRIQPGCYSVSISSTDDEDEEDDERPWSCRWCRLRKKDSSEHAG